MTVNARSVPKVTIWPRDGGPKIDLSPWVIGVEVTQAFQPPNAFQLILAADALRADRLAEIVKRVRLQAVVAVGMDKPGGLMLGLVGSIGQSRVNAGPMFGYAITINGLDIVGKALTRDNILLSLLTEEAAAPFFEHLRKVLGADSPLLLGLRSALGVPDDEESPVGYFATRSVAEIVTWLLQKIPSMLFPTLKHAMGGSGRIGDYIDTSHSVTTWNDERVYTEDPSTYSGNLLGFIRAIVTPDFYEVYTATLPNGTDLPKVALVVRPKPFDDPLTEVAPVTESTGTSWPALKTMIKGLSHHEIRLDQIHRQQTTIHDDDAFAYYVVTSAHELMGNDQQAAEGLKFPLIDTYTTTVYGAKSYEPRLTLVAAAFDDKVAGTVDYVDAIPSSVREFRNRLFNWNRWSTWMESGSVTVDGNDDYRVGDKIFLADHQHPYAKTRGMFAYIIGVNWSWQVGGLYTTTIRFERGHNADVIDAAKAEIAADAAKYGVDPTHYTSS